MSLDRLVKLRFIFPYYCPHFWPQGSLLKWKARDAPVTWLSPLLLPYSNPTRSHLPPETGSDSNLITYVSKVQPTSRGHFQCVGGPWYAPPQIPPEAPGTKVKAKEGRMGTWFRGKGHTSPQPLCSLQTSLTQHRAHQEERCPGRGVESILISRN